MDYVAIAIVVIAVFWMVGVYRTGNAFIFAPRGPRDVPYRCTNYERLRSRYVSGDMELEEFEELVGVLLQTGMEDATWFPVGNEFASVLLTDSSQIFPSRFRRGIMGVPPTRGA